LTLRARLTLWYTIVLAGVLLIFGGAVYVLLSASLTRQVEGTLQRTADNIIQASRVQIGGIPLSTIQLELDLTANVFVQVFDVEGELLQQTRNIPGSITAFDQTTLNSDNSVFSNAQIGEEDFRVLTVPVRESGSNRILVYLQLAASVEIVEQTRELLLFILIDGGVVAIFIAAFVGWMTAAAALRPIEEITESALSITRTDDLSRRIPVSGPANDEVGGLILAFNETLERLESLFETQRRFLADVSHELRTPLTAIRGNVDLIRRMGEADSISLDVITGEVDRMTRMVRDLLLLVQAETGNLPLAQETVELDTLLLEVFQQAKILSNERVHVKIGKEDQAQVKGDRDRLKQVLLNLVANALEHTPVEGTVTLSLVCIGEFARLNVSDTGPGIPKNELPHIFERFYRIDPSRKRKDQSGAGLGLSIAYWIIRGHKGRIEVASDLGKGTTFSVWLPLLEGTYSNGNTKK
jgi:two-component system OmpR family sensor kinase